MFGNFRSLPPEMWHPHVYGLPPKRPTPFSIDDILQSQQLQQQQQQQQQQLHLQLQQKNLLEGLSLLSGAGGLGMVSEGVGSSLGFLKRRGCERQFVNFEMYISRFNGVYNVSYPTVLSPKRRLG
jgi:hypothetical protein